MNPALRASAAHVFVDSLDAPAPSDDDAHHLFRVLRLRDGEVVTVSDGNGSWRTTEVAAGGLVATGPVVTESKPPEVTIAAAIPKGDRCEWMVQKLTEVGVSRIVLLHCARSVVRWDSAKAPRQLERLRKVMLSAASQSRRVWLPVLEGPVEVTKVLSLPGAVLAEPDGAPLAARPEVLVVGPEGGFSPEELATTVPRVSLGSTVMRVETAAVVGAVQALMVT